MIFVSSYFTMISVWNTYPVSWSWNWGCGSSMRRSDYFKVSESWEGRFLYTGDEVVAPKKT